MPTFPATDPVLVFFIAMSAILVAPLIMQRLRGPALVGLIMAGAVLGPSVLGLLERDATIVLLGTVGLLYLMFIAGLSLDLAQFAKVRGLSIGFGSVSYAIPALGALVVGTQLLGFDMPQSLLLGAIVGSHTLLAFPIADRLGITENRAITMATGGTMVTDVLSLVILAIVIAGTSGDSSTSYWASFAIQAIGWTVGAILILPRLGNWFFRNVRLGPAVDFSFLMVILFLMAFMAELVGLAAIIGAFISGLLMNRLVPPRGTLMTRLKFVGDAVFVPFFLLSVGMLVDVSILVSSVSLWVWAIAFTLLVVLGKTGAAKLIQLFLKQSPSEGWTVAGLTIPQAAATLAVTQVGFEAGLFTEVVVNAVVVLILLTSIIGPLMVERYGRQLALLDREREYDPSEAPQRILVPLANPDTADALMDMAIALRSGEGDQPIYPLSVARPGPNEASAVAASEAVLDHAVAHAAAADVSVVPMTRVDNNVVTGMQRAIAERRITTVVIGWQGDFSMGRRVFGTILDRLLDETRQMLMVCRTGHPLNTTKRVIMLIPPLAEFESGFDEAARAVKQISSQFGADLVVLAEDDGHDRLEPRITDLKPELDLEFKKVADWRETSAYLDDTVGPNDLLVILSAREGSLSWRPALNRLPRVISKRFSDSNFLAIYPSEEPRKSN